ncbi:MAG TPA: tetratricopeptide repeat protein [Candidatus Sulfotelmatobacter sp.]|nr:tetratricopeptide repeat protein [Candidatus Sulfotelmatobacter sp.]
MAIATPPAARALDQSSPEYKSAFAAMEADPGNGDKALAFAQVAIQAGDIEGALSALERLLIFNPDLPRIRVEIGILYYRLGSYAEARAYLQRVLDDKTTPLSPEDRARAEDFLARTERGASDFQWHAAVTSGMRYQSNANFGPTTGLARLIGFDFPVSGLGAKRADWSFIGAYGGQVTYDPEVNDWALPFVVEANVSGFGQKQFKREDLDLFFVQPDLGPRFRLDMISQGLTLRPYGLMNYVAVQANNFLMTSGGGINVNAPVTDWFILDMTAESQDRHYTINGLRPRIEDRTGAYDTIQIRPAFALADNQVLSFLLEHDKVEANQRYQRAGYEILGGTYLIRYAAPWGLTDYPWYNAVNLTRTWRFYETADLLVDPTQAERDRQWDATVSQTIGFTENISAVLQVQHTINASNIPNYAYKDLTVITAVSVQF